MNIRSAPFEVGSDRRISYWLKNQTRQNFGDSLSELLFCALNGPVNRPKDGREDGREDGRGDGRGYEIIHLIGSAISAARIAVELECCGALTERPIVFWGCGARDGNEIHADFLRRCDFPAIRGPLTRAALRLAPETPIGDPGLLLPLIYQPRILPEFIGKTICVPHINDRKPDQEILRETGVDLVIRPEIRPSPARLLNLIDIINSAAFILSGALHFCITACAYGRPFCYWDAGHLDVPFKWEDFSASIGLACRFARTLAQGQQTYAEHISGKIRLPPLAPLIARAPLPAPESLLSRAIAFDLRQSAPALPRA
jgi:hypothetical protein